MAARWRVSNDRSDPMVTRRDFLKGAVATTGMALGGSAFAGIALSGSARATDPARLRLDAAFCQPDLAASAAFGAEARRRGVTVHAFDGDITRLWADGVFDAWRARPAVVAGLTTYPAFFLLERIGWDHGMRVVFRGEHKPDRTGRIAHVLEGPAAMLHIFQTDLSARAGFGACVARAAARTPATAAPASTCSLDSTDRWPAGGEHLYSWVIAPRASATA
ncbi:twin-arginine translocation signal domain-containing protein [Rhodanobacter lindaniclasticus]